jgi:hypothetical protein
MPSRSTCREPTGIHDDLAEAKSHRADAQGRFPSSELADEGGLRFHRHRGDRSGQQGVIAIVERDVKALGVAHHVGEQPGDAAPQPLGELRRRHAANRLEATHAHHAFAAVGERHARDHRERRVQPRISAFQRGHDPIRLGRRRIGPLVTRLHDREIHAERRLLPRAAQPER